MMMMIIIIIRGRSSYRLKQTNVLDNVALIKMYSLFN